MNRILKYGINILFSIVIVLLFNYNYKWKISLFSIFLGMGVFFLVKNFKKNKFSILTFINALLFALFFNIGVSYQKGGTLLYLWKSINNLFISVLNIVVFTFVFYLLLDFLFNKFQNMKNREIKLKILKFIFDEHPFLSAFLITLSISLFYLIFFYPGTMSYDGLWQLDVYKGITVIADNHPPIIGFTNHHPALITLIMGFLMDIGRSLLNDNLGMFLYILPQIFVNAFVYAYVLKIMKKMDTPFIIKLGSLIFYSAFPFLVINSITYIKDTMFYLIFLLILVYTYYHFKINYKKNYKVKYLILAILFLILYLFRNTGYYILIISSLTLIFYFFKKDKFVSLMFSFLIVFLIGVNLVYHKVFLPSMNIEEASVREMLSVPLQQTGRYLKKYPSDLSTYEKNVLNNIFDVELTEIAKLYYPNKSDNIKWRFKEYPTNTELKDYFKVWFSMFLKHPFVYFDATLNNIYGYIYPNVMNFVGEEIGFYYIDIVGPVNTGEYKLSWNNLNWGRNILKGTAKTISEAKGIRLLYMPAFYVLIFITACFYLLKVKRVGTLFFLTPLFVIILTCVISPVNAHMRYLEPLMVSIPFVFALILYETRKN